MEAAATYDLIVIGAGIGGIHCARKAGKLGKKVLLIEKGLVGGTCVNIGCVPKKIMHNVAVLWEEMHFWKEVGVVSFDKGAFAWKLLKDKRDEHVKKVQGNHRNNLKKDNVELLEGAARFVEAHKVEVTLPDSQKKLFTAPHIVIATGSKPIMPGRLPGIQHTISSDGFFQLESLPNNLFIIGGGYIGVEISCMLAAFGVKVTICMLEPSIVWPFDREVTKIQMDIMAKMGITIIPEAKVMGVEKLGEKKYQVKFEKQPPVESEMVMCAMGRMPSYDGLDIDKIGIELLPTTRGIKVDQFTNTNIPGVYAVGDVNTRLMLTPVAIAEGKKLAIRLFGKDSTAKVNLEYCPSVVFSHPPMGKCGLTEEEAIKVHGKEKIKVYKTQFNQMYYALSEKKTPTFMKLVCLLPDEKIIGLHGIGREIDEIMQGFSVALSIGATKKAFDEAIAIHPTAGEEFVLMDA